MPRSPQSDHRLSEGQIALAQVPFCVECELIFAGGAHCPRCVDEAVWPLTQWLPYPSPSRPATAWMR
jgi:hypothetical protein